MRDNSSVPCQNCCDKRVTKGIKMRKKIKEKGYEIAVMLVCVAVFCFFVSCKQGFHMDELLSFELANAEFNPWIVTTQPEGGLRNLCIKRLTVRPLAKLWAILRTLSGMCCKTAETVSF